MYFPFLGIYFENSIINILKSTPLNLTVILKYKLKTNKICNYILD
jgi:hypothetical protein